MRAGHDVDIYRSINSSYNPWGLLTYDLLLIYAISYGGRSNLKMYLGVDNKYSSYQLDPKSPSPLSHHVTKLVG